MALDDPRGARRVTAVRVALLALLVATLTACRPALREPVEIFGAGDLGRDGALERLSEARERFERRDLEEARAAARLFDEIAAHAAGTSADGLRYDALVGSIRARVFLAERFPTESERRRYAAEAVNAGQLCERAFPEDAGCAYWLAVAVGSQARERRSTAVDGLDVMEDRLRKAIERDPTVDHGGPHRVLALLYLRAPGWPTGPGDPDLGLEEAERAVAIDGTYPPNRLVLAEALAAVGGDARSREQYTRALELARAARDDGAPAADEWIAEAEEKLETTR